jgi:MFS transporter, SET family, sugar efflux transporter
VWDNFRLIWNDRTIRVAVIALFCVGVTFASTIPYLAIIAIDEVGMSKESFALFYGAIGIANLFGGLFIGYLSDHARDRKNLLVVALGTGAVTYTLIGLMPSFWMLFLGLLVLGPLSSSPYAQLFAVIRSGTKNMSSGETAQLNSFVRGIFALSWTLTPGLVGFYLAWRGVASDSYVIAGVAFALGCGLYLIWGDSTGSASQNQDQWLALKEAAEEAFSVPILLRLLALGLISCVQGLSWALTPLLVIEMAGGTTRDVGILAGIFAALEIPIFILLGNIIKRVALWKVIVAAGLLHACYFFGLGFVSSMWQIYALATFNAIGAAVLLSVHMSYVQDLLPMRPGLGTSLMSIHNLLLRGLGAAVFATSTTWNYSGAAILGAAVTVAGCLLLMILEHRAA